MGPMTNGLQKILTELKADKPRIDYVIGILETLIEIQGTNSKPKETSPILFSDAQNVIDKAKKNAGVAEDEGEILDAKARARLSSVMELSRKSTEIS